MQYKRFRFLLFVVLTLIPSVSLLARAGGGSSSGRGGIVKLILLPFFIAYYFYVNSRINKKRDLTERLLKKISEHDTAWKAGPLRNFVRRSFFTIQEAWCKQDLKALKKLLGPDLFADWKTQINAQLKRGDKNRMDDLTLSQIRFVLVKDFKNNKNDTFSVCLDASAKDYIVDKDGRFVSANAATWFWRAPMTPKQQDFREFWTYQRKTKSFWILTKVEQEGAWHRLVEEENVDRE